MWLETWIQKSIINYLQLKENLWELYFFRTSSWAVRINNPKWKDRFMKTWKAWCPDITLCKNWKFIWLEVKTETWRQNDNQKKAEERIKKAWWEYHIVRSIEDVINLWF